MCWLQTNQIQAICSTVKPRNGARISISAQVLKTRLGWNNHCRHWSSSCLIVSHGQICLRDAQYKPAYNHHVFAWPAWMVVRLLFLMLNDGWQAKTGRGEFSPHPECPWGEFSQKWPQKEWLNNVMKIPQIFPKENGSKWKMIPNRSRSMFDMWLPNQCLRWKTGTKGRCIPTDSDRSTSLAGPSFIHTIYLKNGEICWVRCLGPMRRRYIYIGKTLFLRIGIWVHTRLPQGTLWFGKSHGKHFEIWDIAKWWQIIFSDE